MSEQVSKLIHMLRGTFSKSYYCHFSLARRGPDVAGRPAVYDVHHWRTRVHCGRLSLSKLLIVLLRDVTAFRSVNYACRPATAAAAEALLTSHC